MPRKLLSAFFLILVLGSLTTACTSDSNDGKLRPGQLLWMARVAKSDVVRAGAATVVDGRGNVLVAALNYGQGNYGKGDIGQESREPPSLVLAKYTPDLEAVWTKSIAGGFSPDTVLALAPDAEGNVALTVSGFASSVDFGAGSLDDGVAAMFAGADGKLLWAVNLKSSELSVVPRAVAFGPLGTLVVVGSAQALVDDQGQPLASPGPTRLYAAKLAASDAQIVWSRTFGGDLSDAASLLVGNGVALDPDGNALVIGYFAGTVDLGGELAAAAETGNVVIAKLGGTAGDVMWARHLVHRTSTAPRPALATDASGDFALADDLLSLSAWSEPANNETQTPIGERKPKVTLTRYSGATGDARWQLVFAADDGEVQAQGMAFDQSGNLLATGALRGTAHFGEATAASPTYRAMYVVKCASDGTVAWMRYTSSESETLACGVGPDAQENVLASGTVEVKDPADPSASATRQLFFMKLAP